MNPTVTPAELPSLAGREMAPSSWLEITQERVDRFADATDDHQFIHVDADRAAQTPFGGTIAHGFLSLSLIPFLTQQTAPSFAGLAMAVNYGTDKVRFLQPVRVGSRIRARQKYLDVTERNPGRWLVKSEVTIDVEGAEKPALIAETLLILVFK